MVERGEVTNQAGREVLAKLVADGGDPAEIVEREGLGKVSDAGELEAIVAAAIEAHPAEAEKVKDGAGQAIGPIVGYVMRETKGRADGGEVTKLIRSKPGSVRSLRTAARRSGSARPGPRPPRRRRRRGRSTDGASVSNTAGQAADALARRGWQTSLSKLTVDRLRPRTPCGS